MQVAYPHEMGDESIRRARRREKLRQLLEANGGAAAVAREVGTPKSHFSAMLAGKRGLGDLLAEKLETYFGKPAGWFDQDDIAFWPFSPDVQKVVIHLSDEELVKAENVLRAHLGLPQQSVKEVASGKPTEHAMPSAGQYAGATEAGSGPIKDAEIPAPQRNAPRQVHNQPARQKGGRGA